MELLSRIVVGIGISQASKQSIFIDSSVIYVNESYDTLIERQESDTVRMLSYTRLAGKKLTRKA